VEEKTMHPFGILLVFLAALPLQTGAPAVGKYVLLQRPDVAVVKHCTAQPLEVLDRPKDIAYQVVEVQGDWLWIYTPLGMGWVHRSDVLLPEDAVSIFSGRISANAQDAEAWGRRGVARTLLGDVKGLQDLTEANRLSPGDARWLHRRAQCYASAAEAGRRDSSPQPDSVLKLLDRALADAAEAARLDPKNAAHLALQGSIWRQLGNTEKVAACVEAALRLNPGCADAYCLRAMIREDDARRQNDALADYGKGIELNPGHGDAYNNRALLLWELHAYDRVIGDATACLHLGVRPAQAHRLRGLAWYMKHDPDKALADLDVSLRLEPADKSALMGRAGARQMKGDLAGAVEDMEKAAASAPDDLTILPVLAWGQMKCRNWTRALATLQTWAARAPDDPRAHGGLADLYATCPDGALRDGKKAVECARRACQLTQWKNPYPLDTLAAACAEAGDFAEAIRWEKAALQDESFAARDGVQARAKLQLYEAGQPYHGK
jgi:tetratricopeptide (TPR) repeat protein